MISVTLDSSVYIRAFHTGGLAAILLNHARTGAIRIDVSEAILKETTRVLREKFQWDGYMIHDVWEKLTRTTNLVVPRETLHVIHEDPR